MMRCLMAENQRQRIHEDAVGHRMLEWGCGGTSVWLLNRGVDLNSVEHDDQWITAVRREGDWPHWTPKVVECEPGANATVHEEQPAMASAYINASVRGFRVILIDGVARGACLVNTMVNADPGTIVYLHDTQRDWYDWAIKVCERFIASSEVILPAIGDYPAEMMRLVRCC